MRTFAEAQREPPRALIETKRINEFQLPKRFDLSRGVPSLLDRLNSESIIKRLLTLQGKTVDWAREKANGQTAEIS